MSVLDICKAEVESMRDILVAYPSKDTALKLRSLLECKALMLPMFVQPVQAF